MQVYTVPLVSNHSLVGVNIGRQSGTSSSDVQSLHEHTSELTNPGSAMVQVTPPSVPLSSHQTSLQSIHAPSHSNPSESLIQVHAQNSQSSAEHESHSRHQRMESGDRVRLEEALQSLEEHLCEEGITNEGATFEEMDYNTHL